MAEPPPITFLAPILAGVFVLVVLFFSIATAVLHYHLTRYETNKKRVERNRRAYLGVAALLFVAMAGFLSAALS